MTRIPDRARTLVRVRARHRCERCGVAAPNGHWHHRRSRRVVDEHQHCPCNGVWLCDTCHRDVHDHPVESRTKGWIVSAWVAEPGYVPVPSHWGARTHTCDGGFTFTKGATP